MSEGGCPTGAASTASLPAKGTSRQWLPGIATLAATACEAYPAAVAPCVSGEPTEVASEDERVGHGAVVRNGVTVAAADRVPAICHHIWLGGDLLPRFARLRRSFAAFNPSWQHWLWTDKDVARLALFNQAAYDAASNYGEKSDILRYELLYVFGGVHVDCDMQCVSSLEPLRQGCSFVCGLSNTAAVELNNACIGCSPQHPLTRRLVLGIRTSQLHPAETATRPLGRRMRPRGKAAAALDVALGRVHQGDCHGDGGKLPPALAQLKASQARADKAAAHMDTIARTGPGFLTRTVLPVAACAVRSALAKRCHATAPEADECTHWERVRPRTTAIGSGAARPADAAGGGSRDSGVGAGSGAGAGSEAGDGAASGAGAGATGLDGAERGSGLSLASRSSAEGGGGRSFNEWFATEGCRWRPPGDDVETHTEEGWTKEGCASCEHTEAVQPTSCGDFVVSRDGRDCHRAADSGSDYHSTVVICPRRVMFPLPNTARVDPPPLSSKTFDGDAWCAAVASLLAAAARDGSADTEGGGCGRGEALRPAVQELVVAAVGPDVATTLAPDTLMVHYWARSWQK